MPCVQVHRLTSRARISATAVLQFYEGLGYRNFARFGVGFGLCLRRGGGASVGNSGRSVIRFFRQALENSLSRGVVRTTRLVGATSGVVFVKVKDSNVLTRCKTECFSDLNGFSLCVGSPRFPVCSDVHDDDIAVTLSISKRAPFAIARLGRLGRRNDGVVDVAGDQLSAVTGISSLGVTCCLARRVFRRSGVAARIPIICVLRTITERVRELGPWVGKSFLHVRG